MSLLQWKLSKTFCLVHKAKTEVPRDVRNSKVQKQDKFSLDDPSHSSYLYPKGVTRL